MGKEQSAGQSEHHRLRQVDAIEAEQCRNGAILTVGCMSVVYLQFMPAELRRHQQFHLVTLIFVIECVEEYIQRLCLGFPSVAPDSLVMPIIIDGIGQVTDDTSLVVFQILRNIFFLHNIGFIIFIMNYVLCIVQGQGTGFALPRL